MPMRVFWPVGLSIKEDVVGRQRDDPIYAPLPPPYDKRSESNKDKGRIPGRVE